MQPAHFSSLLPEAFRHKSSRVRLFLPRAILIDFHGTISERRWEDKVIFPYVRRAVASFIKENWTSEMVQKCVPGLKNESFEQRFRHKYEDAPVIEDSTADNDDDNNNNPTGRIQMADQVGDFVSWQISSKKETKETQIIGRLVWLDGFKRRRIVTPIFDDVMPCVRGWREKLGCSIHVISSIDAETLKILFENTDKGNLGQYISGYVCAKETGDKIISEIYKQFYEKLLLSSPTTLQTTKSDTKAATTTTTTKGSPQHKPQSVSPHSPKSLKSSPRGSYAGRSVGVPRSPSASLSPPSVGSTRQQSPKSPASESHARPILFLTDSGQEAKAANQVADGMAFDCLLVNRPGNRQIRTYYLSQFQYIDKFDDIEFVT